MSMFNISKQKHKSNKCSFVFTFFYFLLFIDILLQFHFIFQNKLSKKKNKFNLYRDVPPIVNKNAYKYNPANISNNFFFFDKNRSKTLLYMNLILKFYEIRVMQIL